MMACAVVAVCCVVQIASLLAACGCGKQRARSPEEQVRDTLVEVEQAFESKDAKTIRALLAEGYKDSEEHDRQEVLAFLQVLFRRHPAIHLLTRVVTVEIADSSAAHATVIAAMASHPVKVLEDLPRLHADAYRFDLTFTPTGKGGWQVSGASWRPALPQDLFDP